MLGFPKLKPPKLGFIILVLTDILGWEGVNPYPNDGPGSWAPIIRHSQHRSFEVVQWKRSMCALEILPSERAIFSHQNNKNHGGKNDGFEKKHGWMIFRVYFVCICIQPNFWFLRLSWINEKTHVQIKFVKEKTYKKKTCSPIWSEAWYAGVPPAEPNETATDALSWRRTGKEWPAASLRSGAMSGLQHVSPKLSLIQCEKLKFGCI